MTFSYIHWIKTLYQKMPVQFNWAKKMLPFLKWVLYEVYVQYFFTPQSTNCQQPSDTKSKLSSDSQYVIFSGTPPIDFVIAFAGGCIH